MSAEQRQALISNALWFAGSLALAFAIWFVATIQADPIEQEQFRAIEVQLQYDEDNLIITNSPRTSVRVFVRAQQSVLDLLTAEDIVVRADLNGRDAGTHTVPLIVETARQASADTQPAQITVDLARIEAQQKPVRIEVDNPPPLDYTYEQPVPNVVQAEVRGASERVAEVAYVRGLINLEDRRNAFETEVSLSAVDSDGRRVQNVTVEPRTVSVSAVVYPRPDVKQVAVTPDILVSTLSADHTITMFDWEPKTVYISGTAAQLNALGDTIRTESISLRGRTQDFDVTVPLELPTSLFPLSGDANVQVTVGITAQTTTRQFDNVMVEVIGLPAGYTLQSITPDRLSVILSGPVSTVNNINPSEIQAVLSLADIQAGNNDITPQIVIRQGQVDVSNISVLPSSISVTVLPPPETTPDVQPTAINATPDAIATSAAEATTEPAAP